MSLDLTRREMVVGGAALATLPATPAEAQSRPLNRIAFGSCGHQDKPQPIWDRVNAWAPELFIFLGDNVYGDTLDMNVLRAKYSKLAEKPGFRALRRASQLIATWDDHDYGRDDAGREYPKKRESRDVFMDFWQEPAASPRRTREGIYTSYMFGPEGRRIQVILPDNRWFRSGLIKITEDQDKKGPYLVNSDRTATMLGGTQWEWLEAEMRKPAEIRIFASSTQVLADNPGWEAWVNFQADHQRLLDLIDFAEVNGLIMISGDTHYAELSRLSEGVPYPLWDLTSSGLTETWPYIAPNKLRVGEGYSIPNYGRIAIDWERTDPLIMLEVETIEQRIVISQQVALSSLRG